MRFSAGWPDEISGAVLYGIPIVLLSIVNGPSDVPPWGSVLPGCKMQVGMARTLTYLRALSYSSLSFRRRLVQRAWKGLPKRSWRKRPRRQTFCASSPRASTASCVSVRPDSSHRSRKRSCFLSEGLERMLCVVAG